MTNLFDSDWVTDWLKGCPDAIQILRFLGRESPTISVIAFGEIYEGIYFGHDPTAHG